jgi:uncharacterized protein
MTPETYVSPELQTFLRESHMYAGRGIHGVGHWRRVEANGLMLGRAAGADLVVISHFAWFHDARRLNDDFDPEHGLRGGLLARELNDQHMRLTPAQLEQLFIACRDHTEGHTHPDPTVGCCWDADRLDLVRLGYWIDPRRLATEWGRDPAMIKAAARRYSEGRE